MRGCASGSDTQMDVGEDVKEDSTIQADKDKKRVVNGLMPDQIASIVRCVTSTPSLEGFTYLDTVSDCCIYNIVPKLQLAE